MYIRLAENCFGEHIITDGSNCSKNFIFVFEKKTPPPPPNKENIIKQCQVGDVSGE
jgi:hypothetical protein